MEITGKTHRHVQCQGISLDEDQPFFPCFYKT